MIRGFPVINRFFTPLFKTYLHRMSSLLPQKVYVRCHDDKPFMELSLVYHDETIKEKKFNFNRHKDEKLVNVFSRMKCNIQGALEKKKKMREKRKKSTVERDNPSELPVERDIPISLQHGPTVLSEETLNSDAWVQGALLKIGNFDYEVEYNIPTITSLKLPKNIMSGFPVYPELQLLFADDEKTTYHWFRKVVKKELLGLDPNEIIIINQEYHYKVGEGYYYIPTNADIEHHLRIKVNPICGDRLGEIADAVSPEPVGTGPGICPFDVRHLYTEKNTPQGSFRCVTYNILADLYADRDFARESLFPYCPEYALDIKYRKQLLLKEIIGYNTDVLCLQEVDTRIFKYDLEPMLGSTGLKGVMNTKGDQMEGLATFYRTEKFKFLSSEAITLAKDLLSDPLLADFYYAISKNDQLRERVLARTTIMQLTLLESKEDPSRLLLIGNVHLYFHPNADHIRLLQGALSARYLEDRLTKIQRDFPTKSCSPMIVGDFNSTPDCGTYILLTEGIVKSDIKDWKSNPNEAIEDLNLSQPFRFASACGTPTYTNYTLGFSGCLDYIYYDVSQLKVTDVVPQPTHDIVTLNGALPSIFFPSDHLPQICTLKWC